MSSPLGSSLSVARRLGLAFVSVILVFVAVSATALWSTAKLAEADRWNTHTYKVLGTADDMLKAMINMETGARGFGLAGEDRFLEPWNGGLQAFQKTWGEAKTLTSDNAEQQRRLDAIKAKHEEFVGVVTALIQLRRDVTAGKADMAAFLQEFGAGKDKAAMDAFRGLQAEFDKAERDLLVVRAAAAESQRATNTTVIVGGCFIAIVLATVMGTWVTRSIVRPVQDAVALAEKVAAGDLTARVEAQGKDEVAQLLGALNKMVGSLVQLVSQVRQSSDYIATSSSEIASGNADLSQRTEEQAANLQQTAASMEQMSQTLKDSADTASSATQLARQAREAATNGGEVVGQVVNTMQEIADSSRKISDITGVIDGIAFQTNILALNAAVEAARAGEQGRGFAVVAGEVRTLAQRSADAAREIKRLIGASTEKVEAGSKLVGAAGEAMSDIVSQVRRVDEMIAEIGNATQEQSQGVNQVNDSMAQLDQVTQQNAALVEESSAASESMRQQAQKLANLVGTFALPSHAETPSGFGPGTASAPRAAVKTPSTGLKGKAAAKKPKATPPATHTASASSATPIDTDEWTAI